MPKFAVTTAAAVMIVAAGVGAYLGLSRSLTAAGLQSDEAGAVVPAVTPVSSAKAITVSTPTMDEAEVRRLAREEVQAALAKAAPRKAAADDDDDDDNTAAAAATPTETPIVPLAPAKSATAVPQG